MPCGVSLNRSANSESRRSGRGEGRGPLLRGLEPPARNRRSPLQAGVVPQWLVAAPSAERLNRPTSRRQWFQFILYRTKPLSQIIRRCIGKSCRLHQTANARKLLNLSSGVLNSLVIRCTTAIAAVPFKCRRIPEEAGVAQSSVLCKVTHALRRDHRVRHPVDNDPMFLA